MARTLIGTVVSNKMVKTVSVAVQRVFRDSRLQRTVRETKKYLAHDESSACLPGDSVCVAETRPLSRRKRWIVSEIMRTTRTAQTLEESGAVQPLDEATKHGITATRQ